ncbi:MAG: monovalent cation/H(+) antiporter subunit G [Cryomorphaceae bacterium]|nr:monovalent cation/H(+) antiporter subunit G [Cryomorphaceae bacterium]
MTDFWIFTLSGAGALFILLAAIGILKMPDFYLRVSVTTKAATLGVGLILVASAFAFDHFSVTSRVLAILVFIILTAPVGAHMIGRAANFIGVKMWDKSEFNDLEDKYDKKSHKLK